MPHIFNPVGLVAELIFTLVAVILCLMIYSKTKESYELTKHKGIMYFRDAFLFFAFSYILRTIFSLLFLGRIDVVQRSTAIMPVLIMLLGYFSTMGIIFLILSRIWKRFRYILLIGHLIAIFFSIASFMTRSHMILLFLQCTLLITVIILSTMMHDRRSSDILYVLVSMLWLINLVVIDQKRPVPLEIEILFEVFSLVVLVIIYHKTKKWLG